MVTPVQRLVIVLPAEDQPEELITNLKARLQSGREELGQQGTTPGGQAQPDLGTSPGVSDVVGLPDPPHADGELAEDDVPAVHIPGGASPEPGPELRVRVSTSSPPQMQDLPPRPQRVRGRRIARPDWDKLLR